ncbi:gas vesicle protein K [Nocardiopsis sp. RSe5-2]|uniref:Gas vesicle protein K n=1 Tax=Nocardiopsis endophytica TaxID=3018445 RepID=A0ABT4UD77_9ACTN|nr:gas vesicle protein K [Nocardiopsis endophytica]MDA2814916.1 gas vesicle protein K [Nocardiopsis endophytica]
MQDRNGGRATRAPGEPERVLDTLGEAVARPRSSAAERLDADPDTVERDLVRLVLTVVELVRGLMERQALRRFEGGDLDPEQEERIGMTLMLLEERMDDLCAHYGLEPEDLNLDLGPLGPLLPRDGG